MDGSAARTDHKRYALKFLIPLIFVGISLVSCILMITYRSLGMEFHPWFKPVAFGGVAVAALFYIVAKHYEEEEEEE